MARKLVQPYRLTLSNSSTQHVKIARISANDFSGTSALTMIMKLKINGVVSAGNLFNAPTDGTQEVLGIKNRNTGVAAFRMNIRAGGSSSNTDVTSSEGNYNTTDVMTLGIRYDGANATFWKNGYLGQTTAKTGAFGTLTGDWYVNATGTGSTSHSQDAIWFRAWSTALSNEDMKKAMLSDYITNAIINVIFKEGADTSVDLANGATVTFVNSPTWTAYQSRTVVS